MENESIARPEPLSPDEAQAKTAILAECENLAAAGVTIVAVHFDGYGDSGVTEEVKCFDSEYYAYEEHKPVTYDAAYLEEHFEALVPSGTRTIVAGSATWSSTSARAKLLWSETTVLRTIRRLHMRSSHGPSIRARTEQCQENSVAESRTIWRFITGWMSLRLSSPISFIVHFGTMRKASFYVNASLVSPSPTAKANRFRCAISVNSM